MKAILVILVLGLNVLPAYALDECSLLGDHAVMFAQWKQAGQPLSKTLNYINEGGSSRMAPLYRSLAEDIYASKKKLSPSAWRMLVETQCKEAKGIR